MEAKLQPKEEVLVGLGHPEFFRERFLDVFSVLSVHSVVKSLKDKAK
jgi:hypothetical protein